MLEMIARRTHPIPILVITCFPRRPAFLPEVSYNCSRCWPWVPVNSLNTGGNSIANWNDKSGAIGWGYHTRLFSSHARLDPDGRGATNSSRAYCRTRNQTMKFTASPNTCSVNSSLAIKLSWRPFLRRPGAHADLDRRGEACFRLGSFSGWKTTVNSKSDRLFQNSRFDHSRSIHYNLQTYNCSLFRTTHFTPSR